jgi:hypothetical protein
MLKGPAGATIDAMMRATGGSSTLCAASLPAVHRRLKLNLGSKKVDGKRVYRIAGRS